jgi:hypothetical protein
MDAKRYMTIERWADELDGVFTLPDLKVALDENTLPTLYRAVSALVGGGILIKIKRGIYATPKASLATISSRIEPKAYISTGTVLARKAIIGSIPARRVQAVKVGRPRTYHCDLGTIEHLSIRAHLYFGFVSGSGELMATPEKAFLDVCYFTYRGRRFSFDPATDIDLERLDFDIIAHYLKSYDARFVSFFNSIWRR